MSLDNVVDLSNDGYEIAELVVDDGRYEYLQKGFLDVANIEVHPSQGEGDRWFVRVTITEFNSNKITEIKDYFDIVRLTWRKIK